MKNIILTTMLILGVILISTQAYAVPNLFTDETAFQTALTGNSLDFVEYDFEASSGFPNPLNVNDSETIGSFDGIAFDAKVFEKPLLAISATQVLTGSTGTFSTASIGFSQPTYGFGFYGLDLTFIDNEVIVVEVDFMNGADTTYQIGLGPGDARLDPIYFGVFDNSDTILGIDIYGTDDYGGPRAWAIDDMTVASTNVPEPSSLLLLGMGMLGLAGFRRKFNG